MSASPEHGCEGPATQGTPRSRPLGRCHCTMGRAAARTKSSARFDRTCEKAIRGVADRMHPMVRSRRWGPFPFPPKSVDPRRDPGPPSQSASITPREGARLPIGDVCRGIPGSAGLAAGTWRRCLAAAQAGARRMMPTRSPSATSAGRVLRARICNTAAASQRFSILTEDLCTAANAMA
jgi:hypothetical protein